MAVSEETSWSEGDMKWTGETFAKISLSKSKQIQNEVFKWIGKTTRLLSPLSLNHCGIWRNENGGRRNEANSKGSCEWVELIKNENGIVQSCPFPGDRRWTPDLLGQEIIESNLNLDKQMLKWSCSNWILWPWTNFLWQTWNLAWKNLILILENYLTVGGNLTWVGWRNGTWLVHHCGSIITAYSQWLRNMRIFLLAPSQSIASDVTVLMKLGWSWTWACVCDTSERARASIEPIAMVTRRDKRGMQNTVKVETTGQTTLPSFKKWFGKK